ncbi:hypothetical protein E1B28_003521 [Marasmius oreades]|uniref:Uncharacterized protein n=1 Tax=Marasmius oreades TaxID=181124 RepID=A0A9P7UKQ3_9AGAR|nr:uncharacterized protein E1B28_003521 [Marasmius oreades]KAG7085998.1 hypothetical protein E1B28_003521 [Marasmius oreades]
MKSTICDSCRSDIPLRVPVLPIKNHLFRSDYVPTGVEVNEHSRALEDERNLLEYCDQEIVRISQLLGDLKRERKHIMERIPLRKTFLSPTRRIPVEIWRGIFSLGTARPYTPALMIYYVFVPTGIVSSPDSLNSGLLSSYAEISAKISPVISPIFSGSLATPP